MAGIGVRALRAKPVRDKINLDREYQTIENFGASDAWSMQELGTWSLENRNRVADLLFSRESGIGLSCWRFNIGGGLNPRITTPWRTAETLETSETPTRLDYETTSSNNSQWTRTNRDRFRSGQLSSSSK